jgi:hypothetical protein
MNTLPTKSSTPRLTAPACDTNSNGAESHSSRLLINFNVEALRDGIRRRITDIEIVPIARSVPRLRRPALLAMTSVLAPAPAAQRKALLCVRVRDLPWWLFPVPTVVTL